MSESEFQRLVKARPLPAEPLAIEASAAERAALARRFGLPRVDSLRATVTLEQDGKAVRASGRFEAAIVQTCAISGEDFEVALGEPLALRFVEQSAMAAGGESEEIEIELSGEELDEIEYRGDSFDLGEAVAQSLGLAIDPYAEGPGADAARKAAGIASDEEPNGPLAEALRALKRD